MITRLRIKNFRSLRDTDISLGVNNVLVGANASGKSNILDVLKFLGHIALFGVSKALNERLGFSEVAWKGVDPGPIQIIANFVFDEEGQKYEVEYEIEIDGTATGLITIRRERLTTMQDARRMDIIDFSMGHGVARHLDGTQAFGSPGNPSQSALEANVPGWAGTKFKNYLASWQYFELDPRAMKQVNQAGRANFLSQNGDNLAAWLATLKTSHSEQFRRLEQAARDAFPGLQEITAELTQLQTTFVSSREKFLKTPVHVWALASGELCFIALCSLILRPSELGTTLNCLEEVENHLNPRLIETLVTLHKQWQAVYAEEGGVPQVLITTHSPFVVDQFNLDELIIVEKNRGETRAFRAKDNMSLQELLSDQEQGLGDLWYSGALGGI
ncbi:MAG TPA: AAA family ATPase [Candidatus Saccharimonadales bacterium]|jgi:predicted ATPase|nr:AAA family ATPase [Candidatus Saccharimonadales bacterium]